MDSLGIFLFKLNLVKNHYKKNKLQNLIHSDGLDFTQMDFLERIISIIKIHAVVKNPLKKFTLKIIYK